jgi:hypothetical protein
VGLDIALIGLLIVAFLPHMRYVPSPQDART